MEADKIYLKRKVVKKCHACGKSHVIYKCSNKSSLPQVASASDPYILNLPEALSAGTWVLTFQPGYTLPGNVADIPVRQEITS